jgi:hypothetical protein
VQLLAICEDEVCLFELASCRRTSGKLIELL